MDKAKKDKVKGICGTLLFHAVLLFLLSLPFMSLSYEDPPTRKGGGSIAMNLIKQDPPPPEEVTEEIDIIKDKDIITSEEGKIEVTDTKETDKKKPPKNNPKKPKIPPEKLTDQKKDFDINNDGEINEEEQKKLDEFLEKIGGIGGKDDEEYKEDGVEEKGNGEDKGFGEGLDWAGSSRKGDKTLDCAQGKGTGIMSVETIVDADGKIIYIYEDSFESTLTGLTNATKTQKQKLFDCIKEKYKVTPASGEDKYNKLYLLKLNFIN